MAPSTPCCSCFTGVFGRRGASAAAVAPDNQVALHNCKQVSTIQEALALERPNAGTFLPSPSAAWASPAPRHLSPAPTGGVSLEFDLVMCEFEALEAAKDTLAVQLDTDGARRLATPASGGPRQRSRFEVEQILCSPGSLPAPLPERERENLLKSSLPTATHQMLAKVPGKLLTAGTEEAQALRRSIARGSTLVFVGAGLPGKRFTFERAAALGIKVVIVEHPDSWSANLVNEGVVAKFLPVDMSQASDAVFQAALAHLKKLGEDGLTGKPDGIVTFVELSVPLASRLCESLGLPGHTSAAVDAARNKHATRAALKAAGLPTPRNFLIKTVEDIPTALEQVGIPAVLKPASGAASLGVVKVTKPEDLPVIYQQVVDELSTLVVSSGALVKGSANAGGVNAKNVIDLSVLMEQYLDGSEVDVDVVLSGGEYQYAAVADNGPTMEPYFNETWAVCPSLLPKESQKELKELAIASAKALGFKDGVFHVECKMTSTGPQLIEVNARMGGGQVFECNLRTWGVDLVEETMFAALGIPARPPVPKTPLSAVAYCYVNASHSGVVNDISKLEVVAKRNNVVWAKPLVRVGDKVTGPQDGLPTWLCDLFVSAPTAKEALAFLQSLENEQLVTIS